MIKSNLKDAINLATSFLLAEQRADGSFLDYAWEAHGGGSKWERHTIFSAAIVLLSLSELTESEDLKALKKRAANFLLAQKSNRWSFNYWTKGSNEQKTMPYPDDLDDTSCALAALLKYDKRLIDGKVMAHLIKILTSLEAEEGGPYYTWFKEGKNSKNWKDIDLAVNSNVGFLLSLFEISLPNIEKLMEDHIFKEDFSSPYYASPFSQIYFISRTYNGKLKENIINYLLKRDTNGIWNNPFDTALALNSLINLGCKSKELENGINYLLKSLKKESRKSYPFVVESVKNRKMILSGSPAITIAMSLEAIEKYRKILEADNGLKDKSVLKMSEPMSIKNEILKKSKDRFKSTDPEFKKFAVGYIDRIVGGNTGDLIALFPYEFRESLGPVGKKVSNKMIISLGLANLNGWTAYTIYDNFFDGEGDPKSLSLANLCLRELALLYKGVLRQNKDFIPIFVKIMDRIDEANYKETKNGYFEVKKDIISIPRALPEYGDLSGLAQKSLGHGLGPMAILCFLGYGNESLEFKGFLDWLINYLVTRQLNDDLHDWEEDLKAGRITEVVAALIKNWQLKTKKEKINIRKDLLELQKIF
ncbi:MAG: hypothetical protein UT60_C0037G0010, partial [candidate division CPR2 bacterium GW2011_GWD2_39_7]